MALQEKYKELIDEATASGVSDLSVREQDGTLFIDGNAPSGSVKDKLWNLYDKIDPNFMTGDLVLNVNVDASVAGGKAKVTTESTALNIRKGPGIDQEVIGYAQHLETVTVVSQENAGWWLIRTASGTEGYAASQYLTIE